MNPSTVRPDRMRRLRQMCLALPEAWEKEAWGDPTWRVRGKMFAVQKGNAKNGRPSVWVKGEEGAQGVLVDSDPGRYFVPPYVGQHGWIGVWLDGRSMDWTVLTDLIETSWRMTAPKRVVESHGEGGKRRRVRKGR